MICREGLYEFYFKNHECERPENEGVKGLYPVDFIVETNTHLLFIEVKDFDELKKKIETTSDMAEKAKLRQHDKNRTKEDLNKLILKKDKSNKDSVALFRTKIGEKLKDSILKKCILGYEFKKPVIYIFIMEFASCNTKVRQILRRDIFRGHIPTFSEIKSKQTAIKIEDFELLDIKQFSAKYKFPVRRKKLIKLRNGKKL